MQQRLDEGDLFHATQRQDWHAWLAENYQTEKEIWLVLCKTHAVRRVDHGRYAQAKKERLKKWIEQGRVVKEVLATLGNLEACRRCRSPISGFVLR